MNLPSRLFVLLLWALAASMVGLADDATGDTAVVWQLGDADDNASEFALGPGGFADFLSRDFGWEDRVFVVGHDAVKDRWPYVLPGPSDSWAGSGGMAGRRTQQLNILFGLKQPVPTAG